MLLHTKQSFYVNPQNPVLFIRFRYFPHHPEHFGAKLTPNLQLCFEASPSPDPKALRPLDIQIPVSNQSEF